MNKYLYKLGAVTIALASCTLQAAAQSQPQKLWYNKPSVKWTDALPIGTGKLGGMIYGYSLNERIQFNEETLWTGGPHEYQHNGAVKYLPTIRQLLAEGKQGEAEALAEKEFMGVKYPDEATYVKQKAEWLQQVKADPKYAAVALVDTGWRQMPLTVTNGWESVGLEGLDGALWFRTTFDVPAAWAGKSIYIDLGRVRDMDITFVNGVLIGTTDGMNEQRHYLIPAAAVKKGKNVLAVQVINYFDKGGFVGAKGANKAFVIYPEGTGIDKAVSINGLWKYWIQNNLPPAAPHYQADYQPFGDLWLKMDDPSVTVSDYRRELDIANAVSTVTYKSRGITFFREYFASAPQQAIVVNLKADKAGSISLSAILKTPHTTFTTRKIDDKTLALSLQVKNGVLKGASYLYVTTEKGTVEVLEDKITVKNADAATFYLVAGTSFRNYHDVSGDPDAICAQALQNIKGKSYEAVKVAHINEYQQYFNTFSIDLGTSANAALPTDERIDNFSALKDPALLSLYMQYGRYLLISSSRPGAQAANLQGIWNDMLTPPWGSKYTSNINLQMNYWSAEQLNLSACTEPLIKMIGELAEAGKLTAKEHYGAPGWVLHHNTDLWRGTAPINASNHGIWVTGAAWLCLHLWEHYQFTQDAAFLKQAYPYMKSASDFFVSFLVKDPKTGWLISTPSNSPEQGGLVAGPTMDHQIIRELFKNTIKAAELLKTDAAQQKIWREKYAQIAPNQIGKYGQLQEWLEDKDDPENKHRHQSHLWGVYPGTDITWDSTRNVMRAAQTSLMQRGDGGTGWSLAWKVNLWARFKDAEHTLLMAEKLLSPADGNVGEGGGVYRNMFDAHPPFQIDGNFGGAAGIAEMLVQSHQAYIELLPALPNAFKDGEVKGICARGGYELDITWKQGGLEKVVIRSKAGGVCDLKYKGKRIKQDTEKGKSYTLDATAFKK